MYVNIKIATVRWRRQENDIKSVFTYSYCTHDSKISENCVWTQSNPRPKSIINWKNFKYFLNSVDLGPNFSKNVSFQIHGSLLHRLPQEFTFYTVHLNRLPPRVHTSQNGSFFSFDQRLNLSSNCISPHLLLIRVSSF